MLDELKQAVTFVANLIRPDRQLPALRVVMEDRSDVSVVRYRGCHCCRDADHDRGDEVLSWLAQRMTEGCRGILLDVRGLRVVYPSGITDTLNPMFGLRRTRWLRIAILWAPNRRGPFDRWDALRRVFTGKPGVIGFFLAEREAMTHLRPESSPGDNAAAPTVERS
jgi:hypothetical protein